MFFCHIWICTSCLGWQQNIEAEIYSPSPPNVFTVRHAFIYFLCLIANIQSISSASASFLSMNVEDIQECLKTSSSKLHKILKSIETKFDILKRKTCLLGVRVVLNVDRVISFALSLLPCLLRRVGARFSYSKQFLGFNFIRLRRRIWREHIYSGNPQTGRGDLGIRGNIWIKKSNKRRLGGKREEGISFHISAIQLPQIAWIVRRRIQKSF